MYKFSGRTNKNGTLWQVSVRVTDKKGVPLPRGFLAFWVEDGDIEFMSPAGVHSNTCSKVLQGMDTAQVDTAEDLQQWWAFTAVYHARKDGTPVGYELQRLALLAPHGADWVCLQRMLAQTHPF